MDMRIIKTQNSIINAFLSLRAKKEIEKITIKELCEKAMINKSTFYSHYSDIYDLSEYLESKVASEIVANLERPEDIFTKPEEFNRELFYAYISQESLIQTLFSGSRSSQLLYRIEQSLKEIIFKIRPEYKENVIANVTLTYSIYGGFYAFEKCRQFGDNEVIEIMAALNKKVNELLN
ncbi:MAG: TetR/AcrR family transcriptional regulator [Clostridiales bacterium]|nr:TetR/AcrR family transcriptional regulator [Clostridiales bacterium]